MRKLWLEHCWDDHFAIRGLTGPSIEGSAEEMVAIARAILDGGEFRAKRCAVAPGYAVCYEDQDVGTDLGFWSPRNSLEVVYAPADAARAFAVEVLRKLDQDDGEAMSEFFECAHCHRHFAKMHTDDRGFFIPAPADILPYCSDACACAADANEQMERAEKAEARLAMARLARVLEGYVLSSHVPFFAADDTPPPPPSPFRWGFSKEGDDA